MTCKMVNGVFRFKAPGSCQMFVAPCHNNTRLLCIFFFRVCELVIQNRRLQVWGSFWFQSIMKLLLNSPLNAHAREREREWERQTEAHVAISVFWAVWRIITHVISSGKTDASTPQEKVASPVLSFLKLNSSWERHSPTALTLPLLHCHLFLVPSSLCYFPHPPLPSFKSLTFFEMGVGWGGLVWQN